jgi:leucyl/phenylalanyl-tRNA--protein transferase
MPIFQLSKEIAFPPVELATKEGILAIGGDLSEERLIKAYSEGIFPWYSEGEPILWWSPDPRLILFPAEVRVSHSTNRILKKNLFQITADQDFSRVIHACRLPRKNQSTTWITEEMVTAYSRLYQRGIAHSVEVWRGNHLTGGLYGVSLGRCFFGESMFSSVNNASKVGLISLCRKLQELDFVMIDCQVPNPHLFRMGARSIPRKRFLKLLYQGLSSETIVGNWGSIFSKNGSPS